MRAMIGGGKGKDGGRIEKQKKKREKAGDQQGRKSPEK